MLESYRERTRPSPRDRAGDATSWQRKLALSEARYQEIVEKARH